MRLQAAPDIPVDLVEGFPWMAKLMVVGPEFDVAVEFPVIPAIAFVLYRSEVMSRSLRSGSSPSFVASLRCSTIRAVRLRRSLSAAGCKDAHRKNKVQDE